MDRAEAIGVLTIEQASHRKDGLVDRAIDMAIAALREQSNANQRNSNASNALTNADRIRAMTDEELVNVVPCPLGFSMFRCPKERQCGPCKRDWLQQPCGGADHA